MKKLFVIGLSVLICGFSQAQDTGHYLYFNAGGGMHNLTYKLQNGTETGKFGYTVNAGYSLFFSPHWGLQTGVGLQSFSARSTINFQSNSQQIDTDGESYEFRSNFKNWQEQQQALFLDIPLAIQFRHYFGEKLGLLASVGGKISLPVNASYKTTGGELVTTGYYSQWNVELRNMPQHGFSTYTNSFNGNLTLKSSYMTTADLGGLIKLSDKCDLYIGGYINYGMNNILKANNKLIYQPDGVYNGVLASDQTNSVKPISYGLNVGLYYRLGHKKDKDKEKDKKDKDIKDKRTDSIGSKTNDATDTVFIQAPPIIIYKTDTLLVEVPQANNRSAYEHSLNRIVNTYNYSQNSESLISAKRIHVLTNLKFEFDSDKPLIIENDKIKAISDILKANPVIGLRIVGYTCSIGSRNANIIVGMKRANLVKEKFLEQGVLENQLTAVSKAFDDPLVPNTSETNRALNRRVELILVERDLITGIPVNIIKQDN